MFRPRRALLWWQELLARLELGGRRGAIVGPRGSGKPTLLEDLAGRPELRGWRIHLLRFNADQRRLALRSRWDAGRLRDVRRRRAVELSGLAAPRASRRERRRAGRHDAPRRAPARAAPLRKRLLSSCKVWLHRSAGHCLPAIAASSTPGTTAISARRSARSTADGRQGRMPARRTPSPADDTKGGRAIF